MAQHKDLTPAVFEHETGRPGLDALFEAAVQKPLVVVSAGAGFGKSQAVDAYLRGTGYRAVWFSFSALDNIPARFWENLTDSFALHRPTLGEKMRQLGFPETLQAFDVFLTELTEELYGDNLFVVFVFDDLHLIDEPLVKGFVENLIGAKLENNSIVLITRRWPVLDHDVSVPHTVIGTEELRLTLDETIELFEVMGVKASPEEVESIYNYVSGWPVALSMVGMALARNDMKASDAAAVSGTKPMLFSLFDREIFSQYTPGEQTLLIQLSVLDSFPRGLVHAVSGEQGRDISQLLGGNIFIQYDAAARRFYFYPLYHEFLQEKLLSMKREDVAETYRRAADWCRKNGHYYDAVNYYRQCGCIDKLWETLLLFDATRHTKSEAEFIIGQIGQLPEDFKREHPMTKILLSVLLVNNLDFPEALRVLDEVQGELEAVDPGAPLVGECHIARGLCTLAMEQNGFEKEFERAAELLPKGSGRWGRGLYLVDLGPGIHLQSPRAGELKKSLACYTEGVPYIAQALHGAGQGLDKLCECEALFLTGDLKGAVEPAYQAVYAAQSVGQYDIVGNALFMLLRIYTLTGDYPSLLETFARLDEYAKAEGTSALGIWEIARGWFYSEVDEVGKVAGWIRNASRGGQAPISMDRALLVQMRCLIATGKEAEALALLEHFETITRRKGAVITLLYIEIGRAVAHNYLGNHGPAVEALKAAYGLAKGNKLLTPFIEYGNRTRSLLERARTTGIAGIPREWLEQTHAKAATFAKRQAYLSNRYKQERQGWHTDFGLSKREKELLSNLSQGLTREKISDSMELSLNTVKSMFKQVFAKLGAVNSADAIRIAMINKII